MSYPDSLDLRKLRVFPLAGRNSLARVEDILVDPDAPPIACSDAVAAAVKQAAADIVAARKRDAAVMLIYGAHLLRNGAALIVERMLAGGWITHLATNGAGTIHDWEFAWLGRSTECVRTNVSAGSFGTWDETGRWINTAVLAGGLRSEGYGQSLGRFIIEDGLTLPDPDSLAKLIRDEPASPLTPGRAEMLVAMQTHSLAAGRHDVIHRWKQASILAQAFRHGVPLSVHPGIGYDIISNHPMFCGAAIGRAAEVDFRLFGSAVERLDGGVVLSIGSAIMGPQVFEKNLSCVNNLRRQANRPIVSGHSIHVVDLQDGGGWDWTRGEPPKTNPAYYLRFCKSFSRMGGTMRYVQSDNLVFVQRVLQELKTVAPASRR